MMKRVTLLLLGGVLTCAASGCGKAPQTLIPTEEEIVFTMPEETTPVIIRDETTDAEEPETEKEEMTQEETKEAVVSFVDRAAEGAPVSYQIETVTYEEGAVKVSYPQLVGMQDEELQERLNGEIKKTVLPGNTAEGCSAYEFTYETASAGEGIVSFVFRGYEDYEWSPHPNSIVKTLNLNLVTGENLRLKDYADIASVVSALETGRGYELVSGVGDKEDFDTFLNNGYVTDYALLLLDYDLDLMNRETITTGYSCIRDNQLVLFVTVEHAMGDYAELVFEGEL